MDTGNFQIWVPPSSRYRPKKKWRVEKKYKNRLEKATLKFLKRHLPDAYKEAVYNPRYTWRLTPIARSYHKLRIGDANDIELLYLLRITPKEGDGAYNHTIVLFMGEVIVH